MAFAIVWFKDGKFVDGRTGVDPGPVRAEMEAGSDLYILPGDAKKMRAEQPLAAQRECTALLREARKNGY